MGCICILFGGARAQVVHLLLKPKNHVCSQHTMETLYIQVCVCKIKQYMHNFNDENAIENICMHKTFAFIYSHQHKYITTFLNNNELSS